ncbi:MAG: TetR/AcrR family transcriptional regulator [Pyrinomonadaceae bacterium]
MSAARQHNARQTRRGELRSERVLRAAADLFLERGYDGASVDEVIQRSGGSKTYIYSEFGGKRGLFLAAIEQLCNEVQVSLKIVDVSELPIDDGLRHLARAFVRALLGERHLAFQRLVFAESVRFPKAGETWFQRGLQSACLIFSRFLERGMSAGLLRSANPELAAYLFHDLISGHLLDRTWLGIGKRPGAKEINCMIDAAVDLFVKGYAAPATSRSNRISLQPKMPKV